ncbi:acylneuraminate cytidylyltransferase family protein [Pseudodesulfovibrio sp.]|uniref:acylneuraminate cytidylyltransferase family protein n=1 Tax=unclassified Pseudodesulfovibrio TaxID=2661612 RepID=UPI003B00FF3D
MALPHPEKLGCIAVIPARGGSKGLPRKNILPLCGKPLIAYSIEAALNAKTVDRVVVSTDDEEIAAISREYGAEVPFLRPKEFAGDNSLIGEATGYTYNRLYQEDPRPVIQAVLYPTSPFKTPEMIDTCVMKIRDEGFTTAITVKRIDELPIGSLVHSKRDDRSATYAVNDRLYRPYGNLTVTHPYIRYERIYCHTLSEVEFVDIDTLEDLQLAEKVLLEGLYSPCASQALLKGAAA